MNKSEARTAKRAEVVEAIIFRHEPVHLVARVYGIHERVVFSWLARY